MTFFSGSSSRGLRTALIGPVLGLAAALCAHTGATAGTASTESATAREAFYKGDLTRAATLADSSHDGWIEGLADYRLRKFGDAQASFAALADDASAKDAVRAAGGFWAARAADKAGDAAKAEGYLKTAARFPQTFYGMIAERRLALAAGAEQAKQGGLLALAHLPRPELAPTGGFTIAKSLVYAIVLRESRFNTNARGGAAYGLMQLTPATAARVTGDRHFASNPARLHDAATNLSIGQTYVAKLLGLMKGDLLRGLAAYNAGPGAALRGVGLDATDSLLALESMPGASTRDFVQKVMTNYWNYRRAFGKSSSPTLDAAATGGKMVLASLDD